LLLGEETLFEEDLAELLWLSLRRHHRRSYTLRSRARLSIGAVFAAL
jgi:hypothetical protein